MSRNKIETKDAIDHLCEALKGDSGYYETWKSNIAIAFQDEFNKEYLHKGIWEISNNAAIRFLNLLMQISEMAKLPESGTEGK